MNGYLCRKWWAHSDKPFWASGCASVVGPNKPTCRHGRRINIVCLSESSLLLCQCLLLHLLTSTTNLSLFRWYKLVDVPSVSASQTTAILGSFLPLGLCLIWHKSQWMRSTHDIRFSKVAKNEIWWRVVGPGVVCKYMLELLNNTSEKQIICRNVPNISHDNHLEATISIAFPTGLH